MAILHKATLTPTKDELIAGWLDEQEWAGDGDTTRVGSYRFDDPAGEVGVEAFIYRRGDQVLHVPVTYRSAPLDGAEAALIGTLHHSVLGERWTYDAVGDPVAVACFAEALLGKIEPAVLELYDGDQLVERKESPVQVRVEAGDAAADEGPRIAVTDTESGRLRLVRVVGDEVAGDRRLVATWSDGEAAVAALA